jgi:hypothetical protein
MNELSRPFRALELLIIPYTPGRYPGLWYSALSGLELPPFQQIELPPFSGLELPPFQQLELPPFSGA